MIPQLANSLSSGFTSQQVIAFLMRQFPSQSKKIQKALASGYTAEQVLKFLSGGKKGLAQEEPQIQTQHAKTRNLDIQRREDVNKTALGAAGAGALAIGGTLAAPMATQALQRAAPQLFGPGAIAAPQAPVTPAAIATQATPQLPLNQGPPQSLGTSPLQPPVAPTIAQPQPAIPSQVKPTISTEILNKFPGVESKINDMLASKNTPEAIAQYFKQFNPSQTKKLEKEAGASIQEIISEYIAKKQTQEPPSVEPQSQELDVPEETSKIALSDESTIDVQKRLKIPYGEALRLIEERDKKDFSKIEAGNTVVSPQGMGEIKAIRNGKAIIEIDGKKHQVNEDELIQSPIPEKDLADLYDDLVSGIEKSTGKQVSRNVDWAGYDPNTNELAYKPHGSDKLYAYEDISSEDVDVLTSLLTQRKSTGENFIGAWSAGTESPIGAAMYQLIKKLQAERGGKGNEYKNKYETIYDALEPAKKAAKERHAERKKKAKKPRPH